MGNDLDLFCIAKVHWHQMGTQIDNKNALKEGPLFCGATEVTTGEDASRLHCKSVEARFAAEIE